VAVPRGPGLGIVVDEEAVRMVATIGNDNPLWRIADGTVAE